MKSFFNETIKESYRFPTFLILPKLHEHYESCRRIRISEIDEFAFTVAAFPNRFTK